MKTIEVELRGQEGYWQELWVDGNHIDSAHYFHEEDIINAVNEVLRDHDIFIDFWIEEAEIDPEEEVW